MQKWLPYGQELPGFFWTARRNKVSSTHSRLSLETESETLATFVIRVDSACEMVIACPCGSSAPRTHRGKERFPVIDHHPLFGSDGREDLREVRQGEDHHQCMCVRLDHY